jgi:hypothetical protein
MLRRIFLAVMVWALAAGFVAPGEAASSHMECGHLAALTDSSAADGGNGGMAMGGCESACHAGACVAADPLRPGAVPDYSSAMDLPAHRFARSGTMPETAPPKPPLV